MRSDEHRPAPSRMVIGIDLDNTIIDYRGVFATLAVESGLALERTDDKRLLRDELRRRPGGEDEWQRLQALAYGSRISEARIFDGVAPFLAECRRRAVPLFVLSHKTRWAGIGLYQVDLHEAALGFMDAQRFFAPDGLGLPRESVFFADTRLEKLANVRRVGCTHFIDDLIETFQEPTFPRGVERILFSSEAASDERLEVRCLPTWSEIHDHFF